MCIISIKKRGVPMDWSILDTCERNNPDGSGYAYVKDNKVHIRKGYFDNNDMQTALQKEKIDLDETEIMFHFRIATHGKVSPSTCHPFPMSSNKSDLTKLRTSTDIAVSHNGIIDGMPTHKTYSDTMQFIRFHLGKLRKDIHRSPIQDLIQLAVGDHNILAIMTVRKTYLIGEFVEDNGWLHSNTSYLMPVQNTQSLCVGSGNGGYRYGNVHNDSHDVFGDTSTIVDDEGNVYDGYFSGNNKAHYTNEYSRKTGDYTMCDSCHSMFHWSDYAETLSNGWLLCEVCASDQLLVDVNKYKPSKKKKNKKNKKFLSWEK